MSQSDVLRLSDVRQVFRLVGDVRDLRHDQPAQEQCVVDGLCALIGAPIGWAATFDALPDRLKRLVPLLLTELGQKKSAAQLGLSCHTVRSYVKEIYDMLGVASRQERVAVARGANESGAL